MFDQPAFTFQDALEMVEALDDPLGLKTGVANHRASLKRVAKTDIPGLLTSDLSALPMTLEFIDTFFERLDRHSPPASKEERKARGTWRSRLRTTCRRLLCIPVVRTTDQWDKFLIEVRRVGAKRGLCDQALTPITSTLRNAAVESGLEPSTLTGTWLREVIKVAGRNRRRTLVAGAALMDKLRPDLPDDLRPAPFGPILVPLANQRVSNPLPPDVAAELELYLDQRVAGTTAKGINRNVTIKAGIKNGESTTIYRQSLGWLFDSLCVIGKLAPNSKVNLLELARFDWLGVVVIEAIGDLQVDEGDQRTFPWNQISANTIRSRVRALITMFGTLKNSYLMEEIELHDPTSSSPEKFTPRKLLRTLNQHCRDGMTDAHKTFCRSLVTDSDRQCLFLNMHSICWAQAQSRWKGFQDQGHHDQMRTINLCLVAAILAIVVNIPLRGRTVVSLAILGNNRDISFSKGKRRIEFHISPENMKAKKQFDSSLEDDRYNKPRQIIDWFIKGPRQEIMNDPRFLPESNVDPDLLFCGISRARYNRILSDWSEDAGMRMTTHMFRHGLASILINCCEANIRNVADILGNEPKTAEKNYVFQDLIKRREKTLDMISQHRENLINTQHLGRTKSATK